MKTPLLIITISIVITGFVFGADWPQYLGPTRNAVSTETGLLRSWPEGGPAVLWTVELGPGFGGAAVSKGSVYLLDREGDKQDVIRCIDLRSGKEQWRYAYDAPGSYSFPGSRTVPAVDGTRLYTCGPMGDVTCLDINTHAVVWKTNIWAGFGGERLPNWAITQNPLIHGNLVILAAQTPQAGVVAFNKETGNVVWKTTALPGKTGYVSPTVVTINGEAQIVMISAGGGGRRRRGGDQENQQQEQSNKGVVTGIDPKTGTTLWTYDGWQCSIPVPNVVEAGDGKLLITGGYDAGSAMIKIEKQESGYTAKEVYKTKDFGTHVHPPILYKGYFYANCTDNSRKDGRACMALDGTVKWKTGTDPVFDKGGFILADGLLLSVDGVKGILYLTEPNPEGFKKLAEAKLLDTQQCWGPLALSDGMLLIRDQKQMKCVQVKGGTAVAKPSVKETDKTTGEKQQTEKADTATEKPNTKE